jgi:Zn-dependent protease
VTTCARCDTELAPALLSCPSCHALVHAERLKQLANEAEAAEQAGALKPAMEKWQAALTLLPADSEQFKVIETRIADLTRRATPGKAKMLILGLGERRTVASAFVSFLFYIALFSEWQVALGIIVCIYIHEMGHVYVLRQLGLPASPPLFIPGLGAVVILKQSPSTPHADARVGLAGPVWGLGAALATYGLFLATKAPEWGKIAAFTALMNLFNLTPVWQLDGSRGFHALSREERWLVVIVIGVVFWLTQQRIVLLPGVIAIWRAFEKNAPAERDPSTLGTFIILLAALAWLSAIPIYGYHF